MLLESNSKLLTSDLSVTSELLTSDSYSDLKATSVTSKLLKVT